MNDIVKNILLWMVIAIVLMSVFNNFGQQQTASRQLEYSQFINDVQQQRVKRVVIEGRTIHGYFENGERFTTYSPDDPGLIADLLNNGVAVDARPPE